MSDITPHIVELEPQEAVAVRGEVPFADLAAFFERAFADAARAAEAAGVEIIGPPFGLYPEMPTATVVVEAGFPVSAPVADDGSSHRLVLPGGRAVQATHVGSYDTMEASYDAIRAWIVEQGIEPAVLMWESYLSDPQVEPDPSHWRTKITWPIA